MVVALLVGSLVLEAITKVHSERASDFPIVLYISGVDFLQQRQRWSNRELAGIRRAEQSARKTIAGCGRRDGWVWSLRVGRIEIECAGRIIWPEGIELGEKQIEARLERMVTLEPGEVRLRFRSIFAIDIVRGALRPYGRHAADGDVREERVGGRILQILRQPEAGSVKPDAKRQ